MADPTIQPAAHEDAKVDARAAAKWLIAAFAAVGAVLIGGLGLSSIGDLSEGHLITAAVAFMIAIGGVVAAITLVADVLTPSPTTLKDLANRQRKRNEKRGGDERNAANSRDPLVEYLEGDPSFLQGIAGDVAVDQSLIKACERYEMAVAERSSAAEACWSLESSGEIPTYTTEMQRPLHPAEVKLEVAIARGGMMHETVRRLERIAAAQQTVEKLRGLRWKLTALAVVVAVSIGIFAYTSSTNPPSKDFSGPVLEDVNFNGANLRAANFGGVTIRRSNFKGTDLEGAELKGSTWLGTICPDGSDSDKVGHTCIGHWISTADGNWPSTRSSAHR